MTFRSGLVLGKFMPPHRGHVLLCDFARSMCEQLTILVCSLPDDPILGAARHEWMTALFPGCRVVWCNEIVPQAPEDSSDFWPVWRDLIARHVGPVDMVSASEPYGHRLAQEVGARFLPCDPGRDVAAVSGTAIRQDPMAHWPFLPEVVRPWFARRVCVFGPESTGKTTLARELAAVFRTAWVPEYGRTYTEAFGTELKAGDLDLIARGQTALTQAALRNANRIIIEDTDALLTSVWSEMLLGEDRAGDAVEPADLYLLTNTDIGWVDDGTRYFPDLQRRERFMALCREALERRALPFVEIGGVGPARLQAAVEAITSRLGVTRPD